MKTKWTSAGLTAAQVFTLELFLVILQTIQALKQENWMWNSKLEILFCIDENCVILQDIKHIQVLIWSHNNYIFTITKSLSIAVFIIYVYGTI